MVSFLESADCTCVCHWSVHPCMHTFCGMGGQDAELSMRAGSQDSPSYYKSRLELLDRKTKS